LKYAFFDDTGIRVSGGRNTLNHAIARGSTILITGDLPQVVMKTPMMSDSYSANLWKLGEFRFRVNSSGRPTWLDTFERITTTYYPGITKWVCKSRRFRGIDFLVSIGIAGDWGVAAEIQIHNKSSETIILDFETIFGNLCISPCTGVTTRKRVIEKPTLGRTKHSHNYNNTITKQAEYAIIEGEGITEKVAVTCTGKHTLEIVDIAGILPVQSKEKPVLLIRKPVLLKSGETIQFSVIVAHSVDEKIAKDTVAGFRKARVLDKTQQYYADILSGCTIDTPSELLNMGWRTAVVNLDYDYREPAWLEGLSQWYAYWTNNYQISAAICIGQMERACKALRFFAQKKYGGPCPIMAAGGMPAEWSNQEIQKTRPAITFDDGIPYYLHSLAQYYRWSGDSRLVMELWPQLVGAINRLIGNRDSDNDSMLDWHHHCNVFMYQADGVVLPGAAPSPTLMMAGKMEQWACIARELGKKRDAERWSCTARVMYENSMKYLWSEKDGVFYGIADKKNRLLRTSHFYTDMVFPVLYTTLPDIIKWQSMEHLVIGGFWLKSELIKAGEYLPYPINYPKVTGIVQMAETARAYCRMGDAQRALTLLESCALAATLRTSTPGNFPENVDYKGRAALNWFFGNPIGSFIYAVVDGIFGLEKNEQGNLIMWHPVFPDLWDHAEFKIPGIRVHYIKTGTELEFQLFCDFAQKLEFSTFIPPGEVVTVRLNGENVSYDLQPALMKMRLSIKTDIASKRFDVLIRYKPKKLFVNGPKVLFAKGRVQLKASFPIGEIRDPQGIFEDREVRGRELNARVSSNIGMHQFFISPKGIRTVIPVSVKVAPSLSISISSAVYHWGKKEVTVKTTLQTHTSLPQQSRLVVAFLNRKEAVPIDIRKKKQTISVKFKRIRGLIDIPYQVCCSVLDNGRRIYSFDTSACFTFKGKNCRDRAISLAARGSIAMDMSSYLDGVCIEAQSIRNNNNHGYCYVRGIPLWIEGNRYVSRKVLSSTGIIVNKKIGALALLCIMFHNKAETGMCVGYINLYYKSRMKQRVSLIPGITVCNFPLHGYVNDYHYASGTIKVVPRFLPRGKHFDLLVLQCDASHLLTRFNIKFNKHTETSVAVVGVTAIKRWW